MTKSDRQLARAIYIIALEWGYTKEQVVDWISDDKLWGKHDLSLKIHDKIQKRSRNILTEGIKDGRFGVSYIFGPEVNIKPSK